MIAGRYFDGRNSAPAQVTLEFGVDGQVRIHGLSEPVAARFAEITVSDRVGNITRRIEFPGGAVFETNDNDAIDAALHAAGRSSTSGVVHWLESRWQVALASLAGVVLVTFAFLTWGVPAIANWAADVVPPSMDRAIGSGTLEVLDRTAFEPSKLPKVRQRELQERFAGMTAPLDDGHEYQLELREGRALGPNAFALPSGIVIMTDELVALAKTDDELVAVLAHEIGHVRGRHALRQLLQAAGVSAIAMALLGDVSSISGVLSAAPSLLHAKNSREFETEADTFAREWLKEHGIAESNFDSILCRITGADGKADEIDFFSSHPATGQRARCTAEPEPKD
ncbi:MAG TPA: M48 family metallopeptidase [Steroidobacteraceae bacterium]|nr:M48 family metallopeptidase [Steroidobacteraceae bacterium]